VIGFIAGSFVLTLLLVLLFRKPHPAAWGCGTPVLIGSALIAYILILRPGNSTAGLIIPFGFVWAVMGAIPGATLGA
jgi:uncharacterized membrane protein YfcA